ncbi:MAG: flavodoxin-dependent (E)-4-hydroxy-3-methylbut-2-enyl-diphosphate synthase, partial [Bacteroidales bacterium]
RICKEEDFNNVVISMKASNAQIMVQSTRLLVNKMLEEDMHYPLHIGVTEAGEGEDGRIKSAVGTGALLADGIGDTVRISLTEDPEREIPVAKKIVDYFSGRGNHNPIKAIHDYQLNPFQYKKRITNSVNNAGGKHPPLVISDLSKAEFSIESLVMAGWFYKSSVKNWIFSDIAADYLYLGDINYKFDIPGEKGIILEYGRWKEFRGNKNKCFPLLSLADYFKEQGISDKMNFIKIYYNELNDSVIKKLTGDSTIVLVLETSNINGFAEQRAFFYELIRAKCNIPVIIKRNYNENNKEDFQLKSAADTGGLFLDGLGDGIWLTNTGNVELRDIYKTAFGILQASRARISRTEYISCPSCGRTNFNIQEVASKIRSRTSHLTGLKIAVMGCIVNGPGEMADADYGYVGVGKNKVSLYKARLAVKKNIQEEEAVDELISIIKENGDWREPPEI